MRRAGVLLLCALLSQSGCSLLISSIQTHNSRGTSCMDEPIFPAIDLIGGSIGAVALVYTEKTDESPAYLALPGVFLLSGLIASFTVYACRNPDPSDPNNGIAQPATPDAYRYETPHNVIPPEEREEDPDVRDATLEERGMSVPVFERPEVKDPGPRPRPPEPEKRIECQINPLTQCPEGQSCVLTDGDHGFCRPDSESSQPASEPPT